MKIIRTIDDLKNCLNDIYSDKRGNELAQKITGLIVEQEGDKQQLFLRAFSMLNGDKLNIDKVAEFRDVVFQLNDYKQVLKLFVEFLLFIKHFEHLSVFFNRIFLAQIGNFKYRGTKKMYSIEERYFDRFVECIKFCEIPKEYYIPYFLAIFKSGSDSAMFIFKEPLKEYLDTSLKEELDGFIQLLLNDNNTEGLEYFLTTNTSRTLSIIMENYLSGNDSLQNSKILMAYKRECFNSIEEVIKSGDEEKTVRAIHLLLEFKDRQANDRLLALMSETQSAKVKNLLERELGYIKSIAYPSEQEFITAINTKVKKIQERLYGARLKGYFQRYNLGKDEFEAKAITFVMETIKSIPDETIFDMYEYFKYLPKEMLQTLASVVYEISLQKNKLAKSKWAIRLIALFGKRETVFEFSQEIKKWFTTSNNSGAIYYIYCLAESRRTEFIDVCKDLLKSEPPAKFVKIINKRLKEYSENISLAKSEMQDSLVDDFGLDLSGKKLFNLPSRQLELGFDNDLNIKIINVKTQKMARISDSVKYENGTLKEHIKAIQKEIRTQIKRFKNNFLEDRVYTKEGFSKYVLSHNLLRLVAEKLIWGKYRNGKLYEVFSLHNGEEIHLSGTYLLKEDEYDIALLHPLDIVDQVSSITERYGKSIINQLETPVFESHKYSPNAVWVDSFAGVFCNAKLFIVRLQKLGYKINDLDTTNMYSSLAKANTTLDLLTVVNFDRVKLGGEGDYTTTISKIMFYKLSQLTKNGKKYVVANVDPITLGNMNPKILSNELAQIYLACSK